MVLEQPPNEVQRPTVEAELQASETWYQDNGFGSVESMDSAHQMIVDFVSDQFKELSGDVLDLGCGNGALLHRLAKMTGSFTPHGVDLNEFAIARARELHGDYSENFIQSNIFDEERYLFLSLIHI